MDINDWANHEASNRIVAASNKDGLDLSRLGIEKIPKEIGELSSLVYINLRENRLESLPDSFRNLKNLIEINLEENYFKKFPEILLELPNLKRVSFQKNPWESPPLEVFLNYSRNQSFANLEKIETYFRQRNLYGVEKVYEAKLLIVGEAGAGKTTLARKIQNPKSPLPKDKETTRGIEIHRWNFSIDNGKIFHVNVWDFGGQEIYHRTHQIFLTQRSVYALVADNRREDTDFFWWLNTIELFGGNSPVIIVQNERGNRPKAINIKELLSRFSILKENFAINLKNLSKQKELSSSIKYHLKSLPHAGIELPSSWVKVRLALEKDERNHIDLDEFLAICEEYGFSETSDKFQLSEFLHDIGVILHFQNDPLLSRLIILKPEWGTSGIYKVLDHVKVIKNNGRFDWELLEKIWRNPEFSNRRLELLQLMLNFQLCYKIPLEEKFIAPQLLELSPPENYNNNDWDNPSTLRFRFKYDFMPKGILSRFIVLTHRLIENNNMVWRNGVILFKDDARAEIIELYDLREIRIRVEGINRKALLTIIHHQFEEIHNTVFVNLKYKNLIPCHCNICKNSDEPSLYELKEMIRRLQFQKTTIECLISYEDMQVDEIVENVLNWEDIEEYYQSERAEVPQGIFISYAWGGESEEIAEQVEKALSEAGISAIRDKREIGYKDRIKQFMRRLGQGRAVILILSNRYFESENCMFELLEIAKHGRFLDRVFPIVLDDAKIYKPADRITYLKFWKDQLSEIENAVSGLTPTEIQEFISDYELFLEIKEQIPKISSVLKDVNTLSQKIHIESSFSELIKLINEAI